MILIRLFLILLLLFVPIAGLSGMAFGIPGLWAAAGLSMLLFLLAGLTAPQILQSLQPGVQQDLIIGNRSYRILLLANPSSNVLLVRSFLPGSAKIYLSQGALSLLSSPELEEVLRQALQRSKSRELLPQSLGAAIASVLCLALSREWLNATVLGEAVKSERVSTRLSLRALGFIVLFPWIRLFILSGGRAGATLPTPDPQSKDAASRVLFDNALRKMSEENARWSFQGLVGATRLYLIHPWEKRGILAF